MHVKHVCRQILRQNTKLQNMLEHCKVTHCKIKASVQNSYICCAFFCQKLEIPTDENLYRNITTILNILKQTATFIYVLLQHASRKIHIMHLESL